MFIRKKRVKRSHKTVSYNIITRYLLIRDKLSYITSDLMQKAVIFPKKDFNLCEKVSGKYDNYDVTHIHY